MRSEHIEIGKVFCQEVPLDGARRVEVAEVPGHLVDHVEAAREVVRPFGGVSEGDLHAHEEHVADEVCDELFPVQVELVLGDEVVHLVDVVVCLDVFDLEVQVDVLAHAAAPAHERVQDGLLLERDGDVYLGVVVELLRQDGEVWQNALAVELKVRELLCGERHRELYFEGLWDRRCRVEEEVQILRLVFEEEVEELRVAGEQLVERRVAVVGAVPAVFDSAVAEQAVQRRRVVFQNPHHRVSHEVPQTRDRRDLAGLPRPEAAGVCSCTPDPVSQRRRREQPAPRPDNVVRHLSVLTDDVSVETARTYGLDLVALLLPLSAVDAARLRPLHLCRRLADSVCHAAGLVAESF